MLDFFITIISKKKPKKTKNTDILSIDNMFVE